MCMWLDSRVRIVEGVCVSIVDEGEDMCLGHESGVESLAKVSEQAVTTYLIRWICTHTLHRHGHGCG
jgi:hypothetical protein